VQLLASRVQLAAACTAAAACVTQHRYYGKTQPFGPHSWRVDPSFLTAEQAMADFATLLHNLTHTWGAPDRSGT
jgi:lysosomal Pro-X carboxypeptidase